jgi:carboxypeptidase family protein/TonB-dependent receptor-like protein
MLRKLDVSRSASLIVTTAALLVGLGLAFPASAQTTGGSIVGIVFDAQGGVLPGVTLTARNAETGMVRTTVSEADGKYRLVALPPGRYDVRAELSGFAPIEVKDLTLTIGLEVSHNISLLLEGVQETITVTGASPVVETTKSDVSGVITQQQIDTLPLGNRQPVALALLMPGTSQDAVRPRKFNANLGAGAFTNAGAFLIDGLWNKEPCTGEPRQDFPQNAIREFKVNLSNATAEYGWTASGVVSLATKSGTNLISGEGFGYFRDKSLNTMNKFEQAAHDTKGSPKPDYRRSQFGVALGGPIVQDKVHFFGAVERTKEDKFITVTTGRSQFYSALEGIFPEPEYSNTYFGKTDWQINQQQTLFVRFAGQQQDYTCDSCGGSAVYNSDGGINQPRRSFAGGHTWVIGPKALNEFRAQYSFYGYYPHPVYDTTVFDFASYPDQRNQQFVPTFVFPSVSYGWTAGLYVLQGAKEIRDDFSITTGAHTWKVGGGIRSMRSQDDVPPNNGAWTFSTDQALDGSPASFAALRNPTLFTATGPNTPIRRDLPNIYNELYVQDEWRPVSNLTLNLGLRYDLQTQVWNTGLDATDKNMFPTYGTARDLSAFYDFKNRGDRNNFGPRVGVAWDVKNDGKTVLRGAYGRYYNPIWATTMRGEQTNFRQAAVTISNPSYPDPYGGRDPLSFAATAPQNISIVDNNLQNQWADASTIGISQGITNVMAIHADIVYNDMEGVPLQTNINPRANGTTGNRANPVFARIDQLQNLGYNKYKALLLRVEKRLDKNYQFLVSYTLAKSDGNIPFTGNSGRVTDSQNPGLDVGPAANDRRHVLVASGAFLLPGGLQLGAVWTIRTTMPFNAVAGADLNGDGIVSDFVPGTSRAMGNRDNATLLAAVNAYRATLGLAPFAASQLDSNDYNAIDMRVNKSFALGGHRKLDLIAQVFNVLGRENLAASGGAGGQNGVPPGWTLNVRSDVFGRINQAYNRQQAELAVRFGF